MLNVNIEHIFLEHILIVSLPGSLETDLLMDISDYSLVFNGAKSQYWGWVRV